MIYSNYIKSCNNMLSRMNSLNYTNNYMSALNGVNNANYANNPLNNLLWRKQNDYVNNIKQYTEYNKSSKEFYNEFNEKFTDLKKSASRLKSYSSDSVFVKKYDAFESEKSSTKTNSVEDSSASSSISKDALKTVEDQNTNIINAVQDFADKYNDAVTFLNKNSSKSDNIRDLAQSYINIVKYNKSTLSGIGVNVDANGKLTVDKDKLANAIIENKNAVRNALGDSTSGVAHKVYNKTTVAMIQSKELYPVTKLKSDYINNTYFYNPNNSSILQANQMYLSGLFLNLLL